jgi:hypothetical protein
MKAHRCSECNAVSYTGRPGLYPDQCIPHKETCSVYPSAGQRQVLAEADRQRRVDLARTTTARLIERGFLSAEVQFDAVKLSASDAARLLVDIGG